jgi:CBS domain-containing protein
MTINETNDIDKIIDVMGKYRVMMVPVVEKDGKQIAVCIRTDILKGIMDEKFVTIGRTRIATTTIGESERSLYSPER